MESSSIILLAPPLRPRAHDLGLVLLQPDQVRAAEVGLARIRVVLLYVSRHHAGQGLQELRLSAFAAVFECNARKVVFLQHVQRHALRKDGSSSSLTQENTLHYRKFKNRNNYLQDPSNVLHIVHMLIDIHVTPSWLNHRKAEKFVIPILIPMPNLILISIASRKS